MVQTHHGDRTRASVPSVTPFASAVHRLTIALLLAAIAPAVQAQAVTRPTATLSAGYLRNTGFYDDDGNETQDDTRITSTSLRLAVEAPIYDSGSVTVSAGGRLGASGFGYNGDGALRPQNVDIYGRVGTARASVRLGVAVDIGQNAYEDPSYNSDGQSAVTVQLRGERPAGRVLVFGQADAAFTIPATFDLQFGDNPPVARPVRIDNGDLFGAQAGASVGLGPVSLGVAAYYATRTGGRVEILDPTPDDEGASGPLESQYRYSVGLIPSLQYRSPTGRVVVRAEGSFSDYLSTESIPLGLSLAGRGVQVVRRAATLSVGVGL